MGGAMKHNMHAAYYSNGSSSSGGSNGGWGRRRWNVYLVTVILLLVFGGGVLGVMGLHRLRDRRIFGLLIREKDDQIINLQLLLQKEREQVREIKSKNEEMKMKIYNLRTQKMELSARILEMESTIFSLKDEQKTIEQAFQEKENEVKSLRARHTEAKDQIPQVQALTETLRQKEAEIEDLKHQLQIPTKVWSVSSDDPSIQTARTTIKANVPGSEASINQDNDNNRDVQEFHSQEERKSPTAEITRTDALRYGETENSMQGSDQRENGRLLGGRVMTRKQHFEEPRNSQERETEITGFGRSSQIAQKETYAPENGVGLQTGKKREYESETERTENLGTKMQNHREQAHLTDTKDLSTHGDGQSGRVSDSNGNYYYQGLGIRKGGVKLEMQENAKGGSYRLRWKHRNQKRAKGKRWMASAQQIERKLNSRNNEAVISTNRQLVKGAWETTNIIEGVTPVNQVKIKDMQDESASNGQQLEVHDKLPEGGQGAGHTNINSAENIEESPPGTLNSPNSTDTEDMSKYVAKVEHVEDPQQVNKGWEETLTNSSTAQPHISYDGEPKNTIINSHTSRSSNEGQFHNQEGDKQSRGQNFNISEHTENKNDSIPDDNPRQSPVAENIGIPHDIEDFEKPESGTDVSADSKSIGKKGGDNEEDITETDEPNF